MPRPVTMKDVAAAAGVSPMTVSRAFRADASVGTETRDRIKTIAEEMGYVFDSTAANLRSQRSGFVAVIIPSINNANFSVTVDALSQELEKADLQVLLGNTNYDVLEEERLVEQFLRRRPESVVLIGGHHTTRTRKMLISSNIPVVETWDLPPDPIGHVVGFSNAAAMQPLVDHLLAQGRRKLAFLGGEDRRGLDRQKGFLDAMTARDIKDFVLYSAGAPPLTMKDGAAAMVGLLRDHPDVDAVIAVSDLTAFGALTECQRRGVQVPEQLAIAGFGNYEIAEICVPALTTVDPHPALIGHRAGTLVVDLVRDSSRKSGSQRLEVQFDICVRASTQGAQ